MHITVRLAKCLQMDHYTCEVPVGTSPRGLTLMCRCAPALYPVRIFKAVQKVVKMF